MRRIVLLASLLIAAEVCWSQQPPGEGSCGQGTDLDPGVTLGWLQVPSDDALATLNKGRLDLVASNRSDDFMRVRVRLIADAGDAHKRTQLLPHFTLRPHEHRTLRVELQGLGLKLSDMRFSGLLLATARVTPVRAHAARRGGADGLSRDDAFSPELYFHRPAAGAPWLAYGAEVLRSRFRAGDLSGEVRTPVEGVVVQRITAGGAGERGLVRAREQRIVSLEDAEHGSGTPGGPVGPGDEVTPGGRRICIKWEISLTDKGKLIEAGNGALIREDYWSGGTGNPAGDLANPGGGSPNLVVTARGVRVTLVEGDWAQNFDADPATGCFTFFRDGAGPMSMYVWAYSTDKDDNVVSVVQPFGNLEFPFVFVEAIVPPPVNQQRTYAVGDFTPRATLAAIGAFASYRAHFGLTNKEIRIREDSTCGSPGANNSSAHFDSSTFASGLARIRIHNGQGVCSGASCDCGGADCACDAGDHRRRKFLVAHEMGHAWMLLAAGLNQFEPDVQLGLTDGEETECGTGGGYDILSLEWNAVGAREGMAHFYGTEVFNDHSSGTAVFTWFGDPFDVEFNAPPDPGGRLFNNCTTPHRCGKATVLDWLRFYWDWHTPFEAGDKPNIVTMRNVYAAAVTDDGLQKDNYYLKFREAMENEVTTAEFEDDWDTFAAHNGTDTNPNGMLEGPSCDTFGYPQCFCWEDRSEPLPEECLGMPGCPCANVELPLNLDPPDLEDEGLYPDGIGSYLLNGGGGPAQFCFDSTIGLPDRGAVCGEVQEAGIDFPLCQVCGEDTQFGCPCELDANCEGFDSTPLVCWASSSQGWGGSRPGLCLPDGGSAAGRDHLEELPWFCLDNCASKGNNYRCVYDQLVNSPPGIELNHAQCLDVTCSSPVGFCESRPEAQFCAVDAMCPGNSEPEWLECCVGECTVQEDCAALHYPDTYLCDFATIGTTHGHCVPPECATPLFYNGNTNYCHMFW